MIKLADYVGLLEGSTILHNGRFKLIRRIADSYIETIYCKPTDSGWRKVEHLPLYEELKPLKIGEYKDFIDELTLSKEQLDEMIEL